MQKSILEKKQAETEKVHKKQVLELEQVANLSAAEAKKTLVESLNLLITTRFDTIFECSTINLVFENVIISFFLIIFGRQ